MPVPNLRPYEMCESSRRLLAIVAALACTGFLAGCGEYATWYSFEASPGHVVKIHARRWADVGRPVCYEVIVDGKTVVPLFACMYIAPEDPKPRLSLISVNDGDLVGVVEARRPACLLVLHEFSTGDSWPFETRGGGWRRTHARGKRLLKKLQQEHPGRDFILSSE